MSEDIFKTLGQVAMGVGGAILGSVIAPGIGTAVGGGLGGGLLGGLAGGAIGTAGNALGSAIFRGKAPGLLDSLISFGAGGVPAGFAGYGARTAGSLIPKASLEEIANAAPASLGSAPTNLSMNAVNAGGSFNMPELGSSLSKSSFNLSPYKGGYSSALGYTGGSASNNDLITALSALKPSVPTTKQIVYQGLLTGAAPAAATMLGGLLTRPKDEESPTYTGGAKDYLSEISARRQSRIARRMQLGT